MTYSYAAWWWTGISLMTPNLSILVIFQILRLLSCLFKHAYSCWYWGFHLVNIITKAADCLRLFGDRTSADFMRIELVFVHRWLLICSQNQRSRLTTVRYHLLFDVVFHRFQDLICFVYHLGCSFLDVGFIGSHVVFHAIIFLHFWGLAHKLFHILLYLISDFSFSFALLLLYNALLLCQLFLLLFLSCNLLY